MHALQVQSMLQLRELGGGSLLSSAAASGSKVAFEAVPAALRESLENNQVRFEAPAMSPIK